MGLDASKAADNCREFSSDLEEACSRILAMSSPTITRGRYVPGQP
jgi:hypothetical protein|tara:strand:- start:2541 stop:2675 length:135 start_codon:yes stop_codon:yes gene_type:complete